MSEHAPWRERILMRILTGVLILGGIVAVVFGVTLTVLPKTPDALVIALAYGSYLLFWPLRFLGSLSFRRRAMGFVLAVVLASFSAGIANPNASGPILAGTLAVVLAGVLLGRRALLLTLAATTVGIAIASRAGVPGEIGSGKFIAVLATATEYAALTAVIALIVHNVVSSIDAARGETQRALDHVRSEQRRRTEAEVKLSETRQVLERSQRLETIGRLAGGVAHDFNNALQIILMWSECVRDEPDAEVRAEGLERIHEAAEHASLLTQQLLAFGRRQVLAPRPVNLAALLNRLESSLRRLFPESVEVEVWAPEPAVVFADEAQLTQVALNLALNARDALPASGGRVELRASTDSSQQPPQVHLEIRDNGHGMDDATFAQIFEPFFTTKGDRGSGLGLSTVREIVAASHGAVSVDTAPGRGTTFDVFFEAYADETNGATAPEPAPSSPAGAETILLAEDETLVRRMLQRTLNNAGYHVLPAEDGDAALAIAQEPGIRVDVLFTDGIMPGLGTAELISKVQELHPEAKVVVCSGYLQADLVRQNILEGDYAFVSKPTSAAALLDVVDQALHGTSRRPAASP